jgi:hypothetical protein
MLALCSLPHGVCSCAVPATPTLHRSWLCAPTLVWLLTFSARRPAKFTIRHSDNVDHLPSAQTCFATLTLPGECQLFATVSGHRAVVV